MYLLDLKCTTYRILLELLVHVGEGVVHHTVICLIRPDFCEMICNQWEMAVASRSTVLPLP